MKMDRPYVILNAAMSLDGKIATRAGRARISSPEDLERMQRLRASVDGIMIGINTLTADNPSLRLKVEGMDVPPARIVVDSSLRTPLDARIFSFPGRVIIAASKRADPGKMRDLSKRAEVIVAGESEVDLKQLMKELRGRGLKRVLLEGGGNLNWSMLQAGLVDELSIAIAPLVIGGRDAVTLVEGEGVPSIEKAFKLDLIDISKCGEDVLLRFRARGDQHG